MQDASGPSDPHERLERVAPLVFDMQQYRFVPESNLQIATMMNAVRLAAKTLLECGETISQVLQEQLE